MSLARSGFLTRCGGHGHLDLNQPRRNVARQPKGQQEPMMHTRYDEICLATFTFVVALAAAAVLFTVVAAAL